jgi:hypothetical protein
MCPSNLFMFAMIGLVTLVTIASYRKMYEVAYGNFAVLALLLQGVQETHGNFFTRHSMEGMYKGRRVLHYYFFQHERNRLGLYIQPRTVPRRTGSFMLRYPRITRDTYLRVDKVYFSRAFSLRDIKWANCGNIVPYSESELRGILDELSAAADRVEQGAYGV